MPTAIQPNTAVESRSATKPVVKKPPPAAVPASLPQRRRAAAYARVSLSSETLLHSLSAQVSYYNEKIRKNPAWIFVGVYVDEGLSGTSIRKRDGFNRLIQDCEAGRIDIILTKSISRFARNTVDLLNTVRHLTSINVEVQFEREHMSSLDRRCEFMLSVLASVAQAESYSISENCKWAIRKRFEMGMPRNCSLYGYDIVPVGSGRRAMSVNHVEAAVVRRIFQMFLAGDSCTAISQKLIAAGVRSRHGSILRPAMIADMLRQEKYTGCTLCQKHFVENHITHRELPNRGDLPMVFVEGSHPAIIDRETFRAAQEEMSSRYGAEIVHGIVGRASYMNNRSGEKHPDHRKAVWPEESRRRVAEHLSDRERNENLYDFSRFITCEYCGKHLWAYRRKYRDGGSDILWQCKEHTGKKMPDGAVLKPIYDSDLKDMTAAALGLKEFDPEPVFTVLDHISVRRGEGRTVEVTLHYRDGAAQALPCVHRRRIVTHTENLRKPKAKKS